MKLNLSSKLLVSLSFIIFAMTLSLSYFNSSLIKKSILQREKDFGLTVAENKVKDLDLYFDQIISQSRFIAESLSNKEELSFEKLSFQNSFFESLQEATLFSIQKNETIASSKKIDWKYVDSETTKSAQNKSLQSAISYLRVHIHKYYIVNSSDLFPSEKEETTNSVLSFYIPISKLNGELDQILISHIKTDHIQKYFENYKIGDLQIFNSEGQILLGNSSNDLLGHKNISDTQEFRIVTNLKFNQYSAPFLQQDQKDVILSSVKSKHPYFITHKIKLEKLLVPAELISLSTFQIAGLFLAFSLFFVFLFSIKLTQPLTEMTLATEQIAKGHLTSPIQQPQTFFKDEISNLTDSIRKMTHGLIEREKFKNLFNKFHGSDITEDLLKNEITLRGEKKNIFVFFSDLRGFTQLSEKADPSQVVSLLNEYFSYMVPEINQSGGVVDKFIGDAIMAVWGVPQAKPLDAQKSLMACLKMRLALDKLNQVRLSRNEPELWIGMSLHYGEAISGTIGSNERMEYTVIGNTINTASRIEASTKAFGTDLLISEDVIEHIQGFIYESAGEVEVKGRTTALKLFKVLGYYNEKNEPLIIKTKYSEYKAEAADKVKIVA